jgi:amicyanin
VVDAGRVTPRRIPFTGAVRALRPLYRPRSGPTENRVMVLIRMLRRPAGLAALLLAGGLTLAACSSPSSSPAAAPQSSAAPSASQSAMPPMTMSAPPSASSAQTAPVAGNAVTIQGFAFAPAALTVKAGTTVTWTNQDADAHTVTSVGDTGPLGSAALNTGQSYSYTFTKAGTYKYLCTIHPFMTATVVVTP